MKFPDGMARGRVSVAASNSILVIASHPVWLEKYTEALSTREGLTCLSANSLEAGLHLWREHTPGCILIEDRPADLHAREFLDRIAEDRRKLPCPVLVIAAVPDEVTSTGFLRRGVQDYLALDDSLLFHLPRAIQNAIQRYALLRESERTRGASEALQAGDEPFRNAFANAATGLIIRELGKPGLRVNRAFCEMTGWTEQELATKSIDDITHPDDLAANAQIRQGDQDSVVVDKRYLRPDGSFIWARTSVSRIRDSHGKTRKFLAVVENINERKQAEQVLLENAERFQLLAHSIRQVFWLFSVDPLRCLYVSPAFERIWGVPVQVVYANPVAWLEYVHPEDRHRVGADVEAWFRQECDTILPGEFRILRPDSSVRWLSYQGSPITVGPDGSAHASGITEDITDRKAAEESVRASQQRLQLAHQAAGLAAWEWDVRAKRATLSDEYLNLYGRTRDQVSRSPEEWLEWVHPEDRVRVRTEIELALKSDGIATEYRIVKTDGAVRWVAATGRMIFDAAGAPLRMIGTDVDITSRKLAEQELRRSQERLQRLTNSNIVGIVVATPDGRVTEANNAFLRMVGYDREDLAAGRINWRAMTPPKWEGADLVAMQQMMSTGSVSAHEKEFLRKDGSTVPVLMGAAGMGNRLEALSVVYDLTEQKRITRALEQSERRFRVLTEKSSEQVALIDRNGRTLYVSPSSARFTGYQLEERQGRDPFEIVHPDDLERAKSLFREVMACPGRSLTLEVRVRRKDGEWLWAESVVTNMLDEPAVEAIVVNSRDITERKRAAQALEDSERRFRALIEHGFDYISLYDRNNNRFYSSPSELRLLGYQPGERDGYVPSAHIHPDDLAKAESASREALARCNGSATVELRVRHKNGSWVWVESVITNLLEEHGVEAIVVNSRDINDRKRMVEALEQSERRFRALIENSFDRITLLDKHLNRIYASPSTSRILGYELEEFTSSASFGHIHPDDVAKVKAVLRDVMATPRKTSTVEVRVQRKDGSWLWGESVITNLLEEPGIEAVVINSRDINDRKQIVDALRHSERRFRALIENSAEHIALYDKNGRRTYASPTTLRILGYELEEYLKSEPFSLVHPDDAPRGKAVFREVSARPGSSATVEVRFLHKSGHWMWFELVVTNLLSEPGVEALVVNSRDITERKRSLDALQQSERRFRALIENSSEHITLFDKDFRKTYVSPSTFRLLGYDPHEFVNVPLLELAHPDDAERARTILYDVAARPGSSSTLEMRVRRKDGVWIWGELVITNLLSEPGIEALVVNGRDITERKMAAQWVVEANERLNALIQAAPVAICELDAEGRLTRWNPAATQVFGWTEEEVLGQIPPYIPPEFMDHYLLLQAGWNSGQHLEGLELTGIRADGSPIEISLWTSPIQNADGQLSGVVSIAVDITERRQLEQKLQESEKMRVIGRLAGGIAHDFNNLLTVILGYARLLKEKLPADHQLQKHAAVIHEAGERAAALVEQLLAFSRQKVLQPKVLDLNAVVERSTGMLKRLIGEDIRLAMRLVDGGALVTVDPSQLDQIILNLVVNARDAMPDGGSISIETSIQHTGAAEATRLSLRPGRYAVLVVADTGHGMDDATKARIFEPFFTTKEQGRGTGLGLSTVYGIVQQSAGGIMVQSKPGSGAAFAVYLPSADKPADLADHSEQPRRLESKHGARLGTILLVEDEQSLRELVRNALVQAGYAVIQASDGHEALDAAQSRLTSVDLLLTDVVMPGMRGSELARHLRLKRPELPVIYMSGYNEQDGLDQDGAPAAFVQKPFSLGALLGRVEELILSPASSRNARS